MPSCGIDMKAEAVQPTAAIAIAFAHHQQHCYHSHHHVFILFILFSVHICCCRVANKVYHMAICIVWCPLQIITEAPNNETSND